MIWARLAVAVLAILAAGCATRASVRHLRSELDGVHVELASVRQAQEVAARETGGSLAEAKTLEPRVRELNAALGETTQQLAQLRARVNDTEEGLARMRVELGVRASPPPAPVAPARTASPAREPPPAREAPPVREASPAREAVPAHEALPRPGAPEAAYRTALATFRAREHGQAVLEFLDFLAKFPRHSLASNAQYWIGEAYYVQHDYQQALTEFQKVLDLDAGDGRAADALLKIGFCYVNLHEAPRAQQAWQRVLLEHPDSDAAVRARALLRPRRASAR